MKIISKINNVLSVFGIQISKIKNKNHILKNIYKSNFNKTVLISYLKAPFIHTLSFSHSNHTECKTATEIFNELGYNVDVIDYNIDNDHIDYSIYNVVYGLGFPLERSFYAENSEKIFKIFYSTGCNPFFSYQQSINRIIDFHSRTGILAPESSRVNNFFWAFQYLYPNIIISLGNEFVANTYKLTNPNIDIYPLNAFYFDVYNIDLDKKNFDLAKKNFLWFGSSGLLHKGLDIVIDYFTKRSDITLHICGASKSEKKVFEYYSSIIQNSSNIINHGFVDINSDIFKNIMETCGCAIFPSASEGGAVALLNVIGNGGLVPIFSETTGLDLTSFNLPSKDFYQHLDKSINKVICMHNSEFKRLAEVSMNFVKANHNYEQYRKRLKKTLLETIPY